MWEKDRDRQAKNEMNEIPAVINKEEEERRERR